MREIIADTIMDTLRLLPFLFVTYLAMEWLEHKTGTVTKEMVKRSGRFGPLVGAVLGVVPQCGFSAAAGSLYAGRVITLGTLFSVYLSTSDEMLPILISESAPVALIGRILFCKVAIGLCMGVCIDLLLHRREKEHTHMHIEELCGHAHCHCGEAEKGLLRPALFHTLQVAFFIFLVSLGLNALLEGAGEEALADLFLRYGILGELTAGLIGLLPNCASSVMITQLYLEGVLNFGALLSGLLTGSGIGLLVLYRVNRNWKENVGITIGLYVTGTVFGIVVNAVGLV